jgi:limonene-1,2-epoxide hydrolase
MSKEKKAVVKQFLSLFDGNGWPNLDKVLALFAEDTVCYTVYPTTPKVDGKAALRAELERQSRDSDNPKCDVKVIAGEGNYVLVERVDTFITMGKALTCCICSTFEVNDDGLICAWREYLDSADTLKQLGISAEELEGLLQ